MFHFIHKYVPIKTEHYKKFDSFQFSYNAIIGKEVYQGENYTRIMYKCKNCNKLKTEEIKGTISLDELKGY